MRRDITSALCVQFMHFVHGQHENNNKYEISVSVVTEFLE
jgi:hypothetical protein